MLVSLLLALASTADPKPKPTTPFRNKPEVAPTQLALPKDAHPLLSNPQLNVDGTKIYVARLSAGTEKTTGLHLSVVPTTGEGKATAIDLPIPVFGADAQVLLAPNERSIAVLSGGELWIRALAGKEDPRRLYPPESGDAPLGPHLSHAAFSRDLSWLLIQSPTGWARISADKGELGSVPLKPIDLSSGSIALSPDDQHVLLVRREAGLGYDNGGPVLALTVETGFAQILDKDHVYVAVMFLPNGFPAGVDSNGVLWVLKPGDRVSYFTPAPLKNGEVGHYAIDLGLSTLAWTVVRGADEKTAKAELWTATAPVPPKGKSASP